MTLRQLPYNSCFLLILACLQACVATSPLTLEVLEPALVSIPPEIESVGFVNASYYPVESGLVSDTLTPEYRQGLYIMDTIVNNKIFEGLERALEESPAFETNTLKPFRFGRKDTSDFQKPLKSSVLDMLQDETETDALVVLEHYRFSNRKISGYNLQHFEYEVHLLVYGMSLWRIYDMENREIIDEYVQHDTLEWIATDPYSQEAAMNGLPELINALRETCYQSGYYYGSRILPLWVEVQRIIFMRGSKTLREAYYYTRAGEWERASRIWTRLYRSSNKSLAAKAAYNMALFHEIHDRLDEAIEWINRAWLLKTDSLIKRYREILLMREKARGKLMQQM